MKKYEIILDDNVAEIFDGMLENAECSASAAVANLIIAPMGKAAAMVEFYNDPQRGYVLALMLKGDDGELLWGNELFERVKLLKMAELENIARLTELAGDKVFENMRVRGVC